LRSAVPDLPLSFAFVPGAKRLVLRDGAGTVRVRDLLANKDVVKFATTPHSPCALAVSPDGSVLATAGEGEQEGRLWDLNSGREIGWILAGRDGASRVAFLPDNRTLAAGCRDGAVRLYDLARGEESGIFTKDQYHIYDFALTPDGKLLATRGDWRRSGFKV